MKKILLSITMFILVIFTGCGKEKKIIENVKSIKIHEVSIEDTTVSKMNIIYNASSNQEEEKEFTKLSLYASDMQETLQEERIGLIEKINNYSSKDSPKDTKVYINYRINLYNESLNNMKGYYNYIMENFKNITKKDLKWELIVTDDNRQFVNVYLEESTPSTFLIQMKVNVSGEYITAYESDVYSGAEGNNVTEVINNMKNGLEALEKIVKDKPLELL